MGVEGHGRRIETPTVFTSDEGGADPKLAQLLRAFDRGAATHADVVQVLEMSRLLVPVVAVLEERDDTGGDKSSHMATVTLVQSDGRRGLLAFTSLDSLHAWDPNARPVPASVVDVCAAAIDEGADGVLLDIAGPIRFAIDKQALAHLASLATPGPSACADT